MLWCWHVKHYAPPSSPTDLTNQPTHQSLHTDVNTDKGKDKNTGGYGAFLGASSMLLTFEMYGPYAHHHSLPLRVRRQQSNLCVCDQTLLDLRRELYVQEI